jgi:hypothetical protein
MRAARLPENKQAMRGVASFFFFFFPVSGLLESHVKGHNRWLNGRDFTHLYNSWLLKRYVHITPCARPADPIRVVTWDLSTNGVTQRRWILGRNRSWEHNIWHVVLGSGQILEVLWIADYAIWKLEVGLRTSLSLGGNRSVGYCLSSRAFRK